MPDFERRALSCTSTDAARRALPRWFAAAALGMAATAANEAQAQSGGGARGSEERLGRPTQGAGRRMEGEAGGISFTLEPVGEITFSGDLKRGGGSVSVYRGGVNLGLSTALNEQIRLNLRVESESSSYDFSNATGLIAGTSKPFNDMYSVRVSPSVAYFIDGEWSVVGAGLFEIAGEGSADVSDSITGGGFALVRYAFSEDFSLALGIAAISRLEDDVFAVPLIGIEWQITPEVKFETRGLGGNLTAKLDDEWSFFLEASYETREYRLADDSPQPEGVARDQRVPIGVGVRYRPAGWLECTLRGGASVWQEYQIDDRNGNEISEVRTKPAPYIGLAVEFRF